MTRCTFGDTNIFFYFPKFDRNRGSHWMHFCFFSFCICHTVFRMFSCLQINCQPFYLLQLLKFHPFDRLIAIYLQIEDQGTHYKMISLQPVPGFFSSVQSEWMGEFSKSNGVFKLKRFYRSCIRN